MCYCTKPLCLAAFGLGVAVAVSGPIASVIGWSDGSSVEAVRAIARADDLISGDWEGTASGYAIPEDMHLFVTFEMNEEGEVTGTFTISDEGAPFNGDFDSDTKTLTGEIAANDGSNWEVSLTLDGDELEGDATETNSGVTAEISLERSEE